MILLVHFLLQLLCSSQRVDILSSEETSLTKTDLTILSVKNYFPSYYEIEAHKITSTESIIDLLSSTFIVIDITNSLLFQWKLVEAAKIIGFFHIIVEDSIGDTKGWEYLTMLPLQAHYEALSSFLNYLNWYQYNLIYSESKSAIKVKNWLLEEQNIIHEFCYPSGNNLDVTNAFIGKEVKPTGLTNLLILSEGESATKLVHSIVNNKMYVKNSGVILWSKAIWGALQDGLIIIVQEGLEFVNDSDEYEVTSLMFFFEQINALQSKLGLINSLSTATENHHPKRIFSIVNIQNGQKVIIGKINNGVVNIFGNPIFPGQTSQYPDCSNSLIKVSISDGTTNANGYLFQGNQRVKAGASFAIKYANNTNFVENFNLGIHDLDCSAEFYDHNFSYNCLSKVKDDLGVFFLPSISNGVCLGTISDFKELGINIPLISDFCTASELGNVTSYPKFTRVLKSYQYHASTLAYLLSIFGWKNVVVIYENSTFGLSLYETFMGVATPAGINVLNDEDKRMVKAEYQLSDFEEYKSLLLHAINTNGKIIVLFVEMDYNCAFFMLAHFYDLGLRRGDVLFLFYEIANFFSSIAIGLDKITVEKCSELAYGCISLWQAEWHGDFGQKMWNEWVLERNSTFYMPNQCHAFDSGWLGLSAINLLIQTGGDYSDPNAMINAIRKQKIIGCAGKLVMAFDQNEPEEMIVNINNVLYNETTKEWVDFPVGYYYASNNPQFTFHTDIIWPNGQHKIPGDMRKDKYDCPFHSSLIEDSSLGEGVYIGIILFWAIFALLVSAYEYRKYWGTSAPMLIENCEIILKDIVTHFCIFIEFFEMLALGPDFTWIYWRLSRLYNLFGFLSRTSTYHNYSFWPGVMAWIIICWISFIFTLIVYIKLDEKIKWQISNDLKKLFCELLPFLSDLCFIPAINSLFSAFKCTKSTGSDPSDIFLYADCNQICWEGYHLLIVILSMLSLLVYIPSSVSCRPYLELLEQNKNIYCNQHHLIAKSVFQMWAIILSLTVGDFNKSLHGLAYVLLLITYLFYTYLFQPYNYNFTNLWMGVSIVGVVWGVIISSIYWIDKSSPEVLAVLLLLGWIVIYILGRVFQIKYCPNLLYSNPQKNINVLFKFQLSSRVSADEILQSSERKYTVVSGGSKRENSPILCSN